MNTTILTNNILTNKDSMIQGRTPWNADLDRESRK